MSYVKPGESLREFYKRTNMYWQMAAHEHTQHTGKVCFFLFLNKENPLVSTDLSRIKMRSSFLFKLFSYLFSCACDVTWCGLGITGAP